MTKSTTRVRMTGVSHEEEQEIRERELGRRLIPSPIKKSTFKAVKKALEEKERRKVRADRIKLYNKLPHGVLLPRPVAKKGRPASSPDGLTREGEREYRRNLKKQRPMFRKLIRGLARKAKGEKALKRLRKIKIRLS
jgi:hypothetical protein